MNSTLSARRRSPRNLCISNFAYDGDLGRGLEVLLLVKRTYGKTPKSTGSIIPNHRGSLFSKPYHKGMILRTSLSNDSLSLTNASWQMLATQPTGIDFCGRQATLAAGNSLLVFDDFYTGKISRTIEHPWFGRLHSVEYIGLEKALVTSTSFDTFHTVNTSTGKIEKEVCLWDLGLSKNVFGVHYLRSFQKSLPLPKPLYNVVEGKQQYPNGLPTGLTPNHLNQATLGYDGKILLSAFHQGVIYSYCPEQEKITPVLTGVGHQHALHRDSLTGYILTDTDKERVLFLDDDLTCKMTVEIKGLPQKVPLEEKECWLQYTTNLEGNLYCAVSKPHRSLILFNPMKRTYRKITHDPSWGIQMAVVPFTPFGSARFPMSPSQMIERVFSSVKKDAPQARLYANLFPY